MSEVEDAVFCHSVWIDHCNTIYKWSMETQRGKSFFCQKLRMLFFVTVSGLTTVIPILMVNGDTEGEGE